MNLEGYDNVEWIGEGGLGRVYRATRRSTGGLVAIKELRDLASASPAWTRALRELDVMLRLKGHPGVTSVEEIVYGPNGPCIVMEYVAGGSLVDRAAAGPLTVPEVVLIGRQTADALRAAHELGIVHRDIKPHNLLVSAFGHVKVCDFGISTLARDLGGRTRTNALTLAYASPEELDEADVVGPPADVYSLAATLQHLVTGRKPSFSQRVTELAALTEQAATAEPVARAVLEILVAGQAANPAERPSMLEVLETFERSDALLGARRLSHLVVDPASLVRPVAQMPPEPLPTHGRPPPPPGWSDTRPVPPRPSGLPLHPRPAAGRRSTVTPTATLSRPQPTRRRRRGPVLIAGGGVVAAAVAAGVLLLRPSDVDPERAGGTVAASTPDETSARLAADVAANTTGEALTTTLPATTTAAPTTPAPTAAPTAPPTAAPPAAAPPVAAAAVVENAEARLARLVETDRVFVNSNLLGFFVVQVAGKIMGVVDRQDQVVYTPELMVEKYDELTARFGRVVIIRQDEYNHSVVNPNLYQFLIATPFGSKADGTSWCHANGLVVPDQCFARDRLRQS